MNKIDRSNLGNVVIFRPKGEKASLEVQLKEETVWLTQAQMAELFLTERSVITKHLRNIFQIKELDQKSNVQKMHILLKRKVNQENEPN